MFLVLCILIKLLFYVSLVEVFCPGSYLCDVVVDVSLRSCVEMHQVCDGKSDCPAGDDETECGK